MISKSPKDLYQAVSKNLASKNIEVSEEVTKKFGLFLFGKIKEMIDSLEHTEIYVPKLGYWKFRKMKGSQYFKHASRGNVARLLKDKAPEIIQKAEEKYEERIAKFERLITLHDNYIEERKKFREDKHGYRSNKKRLQEQKQDMGRIEEQDVQEGTCGSNSSGENNNM